MLILNLMSKGLKIMSEIIILHILKNIKVIFLAVLLKKLFCTDDKFDKKLFFTEKKNAFNKLIEAILKEYDHFKNMITKHSNKNLVMSTDDEERFQSGNKCLICDKLFDVGDNKVRDHDNVTGKYRGSTHCSCNVHLKLTKKVPLMFHNLRGHESHLIIQEINKFDVKTSVIPNGLAFIGSMQFIKSSLDALVKNFSDNDFKYLSQEFSGKLSKLVKQKGMCPYECMDSFRRFS